MRWVPGAAAGARPYGSLMPADHLEIETTFDVPLSFAVPELHRVEGVASADAPVEHRLEARLVGDPPGGAGRAREVGGPDRDRRHRGDHRCHGLGLRGTLVVERDVRVPLGAQGVVPRGPAVAQQDEPATHAGLT